MDNSESEIELQEFCKKYLAELQVKYQAGDKLALMTAICACANWEQVLPEWVADAYIENYRDVMFHRKRGWDDAFGKPHRPGIRLADERKFQKYCWSVWADVKERIDAGERIGGEDWWNELAEPYPFTGSTFSKYYYRFKKRYARSLHDL